MCGHPIMFMSRAKSQAEMAETVESILAAPGSCARRAELPSRPGNHYSHCAGTPGTSRPAKASARMPRDVLAPVAAEMM